MLQLTALLIGLLAASAFAIAGPEDKDVEDPQTQKIYDSHKLMVAMEKNHTGNYSHINVDVYMHVVLTSETELNITLDDINQQLEMLNANFEPADISFTLQGAKWVLEPEWAGGHSDDMRKALHEGGSNALNIYIMNYYGDLAASSTFPSQLENPEGPLLDGILTKRVSLLTEKELLTHETGHWFGLLHPFQDIVNNDGDYIDDTPMSSNTCYDNIHAADCHAHNYMSYGGDRNMFTAGQIIRMHSFWDTFRSNGTAVPELPLVPIESVSKGRTRLPFYPEPENRRELYRRCRLKHNNGVQERRENYCGTNSFCRWELFKLAGEQYSSINACLAARTVELLPWIMPPSIEGVECGWKTVIVEQACGTEVFCGRFDDKTVTGAAYVDSHLKWVKYNSSAECLEARESAPQDTQTLG